MNEVEWKEECSILYKTHPLWNATIKKTLIRRSVHFDPESPGNIRQHYHQLQSRSVDQKRFRIGLYSFSFSTIFSRQFFVRIYWHFFLMPTHNAHFTIYIHTQSKTAFPLFLKIPLHFFSPSVNPTLFFPILFAPFTTSFFFLLSSFFHPRPHPHTQTTHKWAPLEIQNESY